MTDASISYLYVAPDLRTGGELVDAALAGTTERHHLRIAPPPQRELDVGAAASRSGVAGVIVELASGLPDDAQLALLTTVRRTGRRTWLYWPGEDAIECVDDERLKSLRRHVSRARWLKRIGLPIDRAVTRWHRGPTALRWIYRGEFPVRRSDILIKLSQLTLRAQPLPLERLAGPAIYLRSDYWWTGAADARAGDVVRSLAAAATPLVCLAASRSGRFDGGAARLVVMDPPRRAGDEDAIVLAPTHYEPIVKAACQVLQPAFLYERITAGQSAGAEISQALSVPYIAEYPGTVALLREALDGAAPFYPELYAQAEELALRQAAIVVVESTAERDNLVARGIEASRILVVTAGGDVARAIAAMLDAARRPPLRAASIETGDAFKDQVQNQWNQNPVGSQHARESQPHSLAWFHEVEQHRYGTYAPWMPEVMEFAVHGGEDVLEIGGGIGTDLAQFAANGARVTDVDLAAGHLRLAEENFKLRGLTGRFIHHDAEALPLPDASFDLVYSNGVIHHTPNTRQVVAEMRRVLRPGGRVVVMLYAEDSLHYWRKLFWWAGIRDGLLDRLSMGEIMSRMVERSANDAKPLVKVYTRARAAALFDGFEGIEIVQRQLEDYELPPLLRPLRATIERRLGWNLIIKARKPR